MHRVQSGSSVSERKFAEKLTILNERGQGILRRVYNIKKLCGDVGQRPSCLVEKQLEGVLKHITRRFPNIDTKDKNHVTAISSYSKDIMSQLPSLYFTFVDIMEFRDITSEVITSLATSQFLLDITVNFDLTRSLLDLMVLYASIMILFGQVDDRRPVAGLYNLAHEAARGNMDPQFPRLGQMVLDFDQPVRRMAEEFIPVSKVILQALMSLPRVYMARNLPAEQLRSNNTHSLAANPQVMLQPTLSAHLPCELLSLETMHRWILFGFMMCYTQLGAPGAGDMWKLALQDGYALILFRDESLPVHAVYEKLLGDSKSRDDRKRASEASDALGQALQFAGPFHRERRRYLRTALAELCLLLADSPGLLGPKAVVALSALTLARDEVLWLLKHVCIPAPKAKHRPSPDDYSDPQLPHLLFLIVQLKALMLKHRRVVQNYHLKYLGGFDAQLMRHTVMNIQVCPEEESLIMTSFVDTLARLHGVEADDKTEFDFSALRLDWFRLQCLTSVNKAALSLRDRENADLAPAMNAVAVHSRFVDSFEQLLTQQADLSFFGFFFRQFETEFARCLKTPSQLRYVVAFPVVASEFLNCTSPFCPEERMVIGERCVNAINHCLELTAKEVKQLLGHLCEERMALDDQLLPCRGAGYYLQAHSKVKTKDKKHGAPVVTAPGEESMRRTREETARSDASIQSLAEISFSVNFFPSITAWEHTFVPREYLVSHLEDLFMKHVVTMMNYNHDTQEIARPSEVLARVQSYMASLRTLELYVNIDMTRVLTAVLLQETQPLDSKGESTIASTYTSWYTNTLLKRVATGGICFSKSRKCFVSRAALAFKAEDYTDMKELEALAEIIGPYGVRYMGEKLMDQVSGQVKELKRLVVANQDTLLTLHNNRDKPEIFSEIGKRVRNAEDLLARTVIVGIIVGFRKLTLEALNTVLTYRIPFVLSSIRDFKSNLPDRQSSVADHMASAAGIQCDVDPLLCAVMKNHCDKSREDYSVWSLYLVFLAVTLPDLAYKPDSNFLPFFEGHENNAHSLAIAVNALAGALFSFYGEQHQRDRMKEFLVFTSSRIMTLVKETEREKDTPKAREAIYLLLDLFVRESPFLTRDQLESCFPYALLRDAYNSVYRKPAVLSRKVRESETPF